MKRALCFLPLLTSTLPARAAVLYTGGDVSTLWSYNEILGPSSTSPYFDRSYSNVSIPAGQTWTLTGVSAFVADPSSSFSNSLAPAASIDIRTGMSLSSYGSPVSAATATNTTYASQAYQSFGWPVYDWTISLPSPVTLTGGQTYWIAVTPLHPDASNAGIMWSNGANSLGGPTDQSSLRWTSNFALGNYLATEPGDFALQILGPPLPEPSTLLPLFTLFTLLPFLSRSHRNRPPAK